MTAVSDTSLSRQFTALARDIKLSHTVFAQPWAIFATFLAAGGWPQWGQLLLILLCMVTARTFAMSMNRLLDASLDARNPRTAGRAIPSGRLSRSFVLLASLVCAGAFVASASGFWFWYDNPLPPLLAVPVLAMIGAYPLLKRFTQLCHYYLGAALALAPLCAWVAIAGNVALAPVLMAIAVLLWTAGFDIIYACQDYESDRATGVFSVPARLGIAPALWVARLSHALSFAAMASLLLVAAPPLGWLYAAAVGAAGVLLVVEDSIVSPCNLSRVGMAFFTLNGIISLLLGLAGVIDVLR
jgi:4-hydroxybenzoate polyprenyltransferase